MVPMLERGDESGDELFIVPARVIEGRELGEVIEKGGCSNDSE